MNTRTILSGVATLIALAICMSGCGDDENANPGNNVTPPVASLSLDVEEIAGPGGTILYQGVEYTDQLDVPPNTLMGVVINDQGYLYHPAMGTDVDFSSESNKAAVAFFMLSHQTDTTALSLGGANASVEMRSLANNAETELLTKVKVMRVDNTLTFTNTASRWAAVKITEGASEKKHYLLPINTGVDSNLIRWVGSVTDLSKYGVKADDFNATPLIVTVSSSAKIETFGACFRGLAFFTSAVAIPWPDGTKEGLDQDRDLVILLNVVDIYHTIMEGVKNIVGAAAPFECFDIITAYLINWIEMEYFGALTESERVRTDFYKTWSLDYAYSNLSCLGVLATSGVWELFGTFWDLVGAASFFKDNVLLINNAILYAAAYDKTDLGETFDFQINIPGYKGPFKTAAIGFGLGEFGGGLASYPTVFATTAIDSEWLISDELIITLSKDLGGPGIYSLSDKEVWEGDPADVLFHTLEIMDEYLSADWPTDFGEIEGSTLNLESYGVNYGDRLRGSITLNVKGMQEKCIDDDCSDTSFVTIEGTITGTFDGVIKK